MTRAERKYRNLIRANIKYKLAPHSEYVEKLIQENPTDKAAILSAERIIYREMQEK